MCQQFFFVTRLTADKVEVLARSISKTSRCTSSQGNTGHFGYKQATDLVSVSLLIVIRECCKSNWNERSEMYSYFVHFVKVIGFITANSKRDKPDKWLCKTGLRHLNDISSIKHETKALCDLQFGETCLFSKSGIKVSLMFWNQSCIHCEAAWHGPWFISSIQYLV